ncbi:MAG TPA: DNA mismatch repair endonuclease MutL [Kofleriaceae bacterium]|nr:DNA mismatch repair endonuclease MutL [Kofleriaceae bacterium]
MDSVIAVLPAEVVDQIAAGEVIERPASVVKELVDNAIDAGAKTIAIETAAGGRALVRVVDDGCGMSARDAVLALERHATSKLRRLDDLWGLATMGFRGEALPSIASVSRLTLTTRRANDLGATRVTMTGGRLDGVTEVGAPVGTCVEVADLLWNVPARLKFLKTDATEATHVTELATKVAMAHPSLHVRLRHDGRVALDAPPDRDGLARAHALLGARIAERLVAASGEEGGVRVTAYVGAPELAQTTSRAVQLFIGRRPVRDRGLLHAIAMAYGELVPRGRYPLAIVHVDVPAGMVDFNVHPQKLEVRFSDPGAVAAAVRHVVAAGIARAPWRDDAGGAIAWTSVAPPALPAGGGATALAQRYAAQLREAREREWTRQAKLGFEDGPREWVRGVKTTARAAEASGSEARGSRLQASGAGSGSGSEPAARSPQPEAFFSSLRYLGQLDLTYLVCEADGELVLIDQHVAHERVELARLQAQGGRAVATQRMLFPTTIEVEPELVALAEQLAGVLARVGFEAEAFGQTTLAVKSVPGGLRHGDPAELLRELLAKWADEGAPTESERLSRALAEIACHSVVRAGDRLTPGEAEALLQQMDDVDFRDKGPHDRPALLRVPIAELARRFGR